MTDDALSGHGPRPTVAYAQVDPDDADLVVPATFMDGNVFSVALPTEGVDGTVTYRLCAEDPQENVGCSEDLSNEVAGGGGTDTGGDDGSADADAEGCSCRTTRPPPQR